MPASVPATVGAKMTETEAVASGASVSGNVNAPVPVNPVPAVVTPVIVSGAVPEEVSINDCIDEDPIFTFPNDNVVALRVSPGDVTAGGSRVRVNVAEVPNVAASDTGVATVTAIAVAVKFAVDAPTTTETDAGIVTSVLLDPRVTVSALVATPVSVTVQASVPAPVTVAPAQVSDFNVTGGGVMTGSRVIVASAVFPASKAVTTTEVTVVTAFAVPTNVTLDEPLAIVMLDGTVNNGLELDKEIVVEDVAAPLSLAVKVSVPAPVIVPVSGTKVVSVGGGGGVTPFGVSTK